MIRFESQNFHLNRSSPGMENRGQNLIDRAIEMARDKDLSDPELAELGTQVNSAETRAFVESLASHRQVFIDTVNSADFNPSQFQWDTKGYRDKDTSEGVVWEVARDWQDQGDWILTEMADGHLDTPEGRLQVMSQTRQDNFRTESTLQGEDTDNWRCGPSSVVAGVFYKEGVEGLSQLATAIEEDAERYGVSAGRVAEVRQKLDSGQPLTQNDIHLMQDALFQVLHGIEHDGLVNIHDRTINSFITRHPEIQTMFRDMEVINIGGHDVLGFEHQGQAMIYDPQPEIGSTLKTGQTLSNFYTDGAVRGFTPTLAYKGALARGGIGEILMEQDLSKAREALAADGNQMTSQSPHDTAEHLLAMIRTYASGNSEISLSDIEAFVSEIDHNPYQDDNVMTSVLAEMAQPSGQYSGVQDLKRDLYETFQQTAPHLCDTMQRIAAEWFDSIQN